MVLVNIAFVTKCEVIYSVLSFPLLGLVYGRVLSISFFMYYLHCTHYDLVSEFGPHM